MKPRPPKLLVIGASGQIGSECLRAFAERGYAVEGTCSTRAVPGLRPLDFGSEEAVRVEIRRVRPDWCVLSAAMTQVDDCESRPDRARLLNAEAAGWTADETAKAGGRTISLSTEYVFDGTAGPYVEEAPPNPISVYGATKLAGERAVLAASSDNLVVRTTVVYSYQPGGKNFLMQLWTALREGREMSVPSDQESSPTYAPDLGTVIARAAGSGLRGVLHAAGPEVMSRYEFARRAAEVWGFSAERLRLVETGRLGQKARRPLRAGLRTDRLRGLFGDAMRGVEDGARSFAEAALR